MNNFIIVLSLFMLFSCRNDDSQQIQKNSFCYWKTELNIDSAVFKNLKQAGTNHLYIRYFDVDWSAGANMAVPKGELTFSYETMSFADFTPVVFITNTVMLKSTREQLKDLAKKITKKINNKNSYFAENYIRTQLDTIADWENNTVNGIKYENVYAAYDSARKMLLSKYNQTVNELLIDCDWNEKSKENYFYFLQCMKTENNERQISSTLRLWQYKYRDKAGIPPADRCLLMCYSTGNPKEYGVENSIATKKDIEAYLSQNDYPVTLDIALPIFSWGIIFGNKTFKGLVSDITNEMASADTVHFLQIKPNYFRFKTDTVIGDLYVRYGNELRTEQISVQELIEIAQLIKNKINLKEQSRITFFSLDTNYLNRTGYENIKNIYNKFN